MQTQALYRSLLKGNKCRGCDATDVLVLFLQLKNEGWMGTVNNFAGEHAGKLLPAPSTTFTFFTSALRIAKGSWGTLQHQR